MRRRLLIDERVQVLSPARKAVIAGMVLDNYSGVLIAKKRSETKERRNDRRGRA